MGSDGRLLLTVDISGCQFTDMPVITTTVNGDYDDGRMTGTSAVYNVTKDGFTMQLHGFIATAYSESDTKISVGQANSWKWSVNWSASGFNC